MITKAVRDILNASTTITDQLATFEFASGTPTPAIFTFDDESEKPPEDVALPAIYIRSAGGVNFSDRSSDGARVIIRVTIWGDKDRGNIEGLARDVFKLLNKAQLTQVGITDIFGCLATPPQALTDNDGFQGFLINVNPFVMIDD